MPKRYRVSFLIGLTMVSLTAQSGNTIIRRHDVPDEKYLAYGESFKNVVARLEIPRKEGTATGTGTLLGNEWIVTAAHVAHKSAPSAEEKPMAEIAGTKYEIAEIFLNPEWAVGKNTAGNDIALLRLAKPLPYRGIDCLYQGRQERGKVVSLAGYGFAGDGVNGAIRVRDPKLRAATVRVGRAKGDQLSWTFHAPADRRSTPMEGISGPADSGGPALLKVRGNWCLVGVSARQEALQGGAFKYGALELYSRVSFHRSWLDSVLKSKGST